MLVEISKLKITDFHSKLYLSNDIDSLAENIKDLGLLEPIVIKRDFTIISGVRRLQALKKLEYTKVDVIIKDVEEEDEKLTVISFNKQRIKTNRELLDEAKYLKEIWGKPRGRKSLNEILENGENAEPVDTRKRISEELKISAGNISKLEYIDKVRPDLIAEIDKGVISIEQAHKGLKKHEEEKKIIKLESTLPTTITTAYYDIINKSSDDLSDLADESIQTIFTSPPYWNKRTFSDDTNELGSEITSELFVQRMAKHLHACHRVLKSEGSFFLNLGDTYYDKCLQSIPHRIVIELVKYGWILRNTIIWKKKNTLPSTVKDNLTPTYEFIFHLVKSHSYYYNPILIPTQTESKLGVNIISQKCRNNKSIDFGSICINGLKEGKKLEDYWTEDTVITAGANQTIVKKYGGTDHPAPFPSEIVTLPILQTSKPGDIVMDVFSGTATVGEIAILLGRKYVGYEFNPNHNDIQTRRLEDAIKTYNENQMPKDLMQAA
jgi:DNA modification methylase/ParB-like chromosome segregation protein Spo0J